jgi:hypothetical protein
VVDTDLARRRGKVVVGSDVWHFPSILPPDDHDDYRYSTQAFYSDRRWQPRSVLGVRQCVRCASVQKAAITWPADAYFLAIVKNTKLFAFTRDEWCGIMEYIASGSRRELYRRGKTPHAVRLLPRTLIAGRNREVVVKAMRRVLEQG